MCLTARFSQSIILNFTSVLFSPIYVAARRTPIDATRDPRRTSTVHFRDFFPRLLTENWGEKPWFKDRRTVTDCGALHKSLAQLGFT